MKKYFATHALLIALFALLAVTSFAQNPQSYLNDVGSTAYGINIPVENGFINVSNGNLHLEFPLAGHPQRGGLSLNEKIVYDSRIWMFSPFGTQGSYHWWPYNIFGTSTTSGGWQFISGGETGLIGANFIGQSNNDCTDSRGNPGYDVVNTFALTWTDPSGTLHPFNATEYQESNDCTRPSDSQYIYPGSASDGSGYRIVDDGSGNPLVIDSKGTQVYPQIIDRYGNYWSKDSNGNLIDDTGRTPVIVTQDSQNASITYYDVLAPNGATYPNETGLRIRYTVTNATVPVDTAFGQSDIHEWCSPCTQQPAQLLNPVQSIQLPDGSQYSFTYDSYGELKTMTLPTSGVIHYDYSNFWDSAGNANRWLTSRTLGSDPAMTFTPSVVTTCANFSTGCKEQVLVHKPSGDETAYVLTLNNGAWKTSESVFTGPAHPMSTNGPPTTFTTSDNTYTNGCADSRYCNGANYVSQSITTMALFPNTTQSSFVIKQTKSSYDSSGPRLTDTKEWDFLSQSNYNGPAPPPSGIPAREIQYTYTGYDPYQVTVFDSGGNAIASTTYGYTSSATATSGVTQHGTANAGGPYLHTVTHSLNTDPTHSPTITYGMDDTGQVISVTDADQHPATIFSYQCANSLPYQTILPSAGSNTPLQITTSGYDCSSGAITSTTDPNTRSTTYTYEAVMGRPWVTTRPDLGTSTYTYPSTAEIDVAVTAAPSPTSNSRSIADIYGRPSYEITNNNAVQTTYDANGRVYCQSNPYSLAPPSPIVNTCITNYDGQDRPLSQTLADSVNTLSWSYSNNVVTSYDEHNLPWIRTSDAFGRLISVIEPSSGTTVGSTASYSYDALGNLHTISQTGYLAGSSATSTRSFTYDSMSRLVCASIPESSPQSGQNACPLSATFTPFPSGVTTYSYDLAGNMQSKTDPGGNVIGYSYDNLNRLTAKWNGSVWLGRFGYDGFAQDLAALPNSLNAIGRLSQITNMVNADTQYSYDAMGHVQTQRYCLPDNCGAVRTASAIYDQAGNMTDLTYPDGHHIHQTWNSSGQSVSSNLVDIGGTAISQSYLNSATYQPDGSPLALSFNNNGIIQQTFTENSRLQLKGFTIAGSAAPFNGQTFLSHSYCYVPVLPGQNCPSSSTGNNGLIWQIADNSSPLNTQTFEHDALSRISSFSIGSTLVQKYQTDSFGNMSPLVGNTPSYTFDAANRITNLPCATSLTAYSAGNQICDSDSNGGARSIGFNVENKISQISMANSNTPFASYVYGGDGTRVQASSPGKFTEYVSFGGQTIAEMDQNGSWTDYIYMNGNKIARVAQTGPAVHFHGTNPDPNTECDESFQTVPYSVKQGDILSWREYKQNAVGGINVWFQNAGGIQWQANDTQGQPVNQDHTNSQWQSRSLDLSPWANDQINQYSILKDVQSSPSTWDIWVGDMAIISLDGTVTQITGAAGLSVLGGGCQGNASGLVAEFQAAASAPDASIGLGTHFYLADHVGSAQMEFSNGGWPTWIGHFGPYGQKLDASSTANHYLFASLERDETGLDHATFRQYSSIVGRWLSPDPFDGSMNLNNPQTFNRYGYVSNMPMNLIDPSGLEGVCGFTLNRDKDNLGPPIQFSGDAGAWESLGGCLSLGIPNIIGKFLHPKFTGTTTPRPNGQIWDEHGGFHAKANSGIGDILGLPNGGCEFGACGSSFQQRGPVEPLHIPVYAGPPLPYREDPFDAWMYKHVTEPSRHWFERSGPTCRFVANYYLKDSKIAEGDTGIALATVRIPGLQPVAAVFGTTATIYGSTAALEGGVNRWVCH